MPATDDLLVKLILYGLLPLWGVAGLFDWFCHRATHVELTSGVKESLMHSLMGVQLGIPIVLCLVFRINALVLVLCILAWLSHEAVAHWDVHYATPLRRISIWEVHVHNYMATIPLYLLMLILVINWNTASKLFTLQVSSGDFRLQRLDAPHGSPSYLRDYLLFMSLACVLPYVEENARCLRAALAARRVRP
jgi:hypothetical protein